MNYCIGTSFILKINNKRGVWVVTEINKKTNQYKFAGVSDTLKGEKASINIDDFDRKIEPQCMPIFKIKGQIVETEDRIYIKSIKENNDELGIKA